MWFHIWFCCVRSQQRLTILYTIGVIIARIYADYFLSNIIEFLTDFLHLSPYLAVAIINVNEGLAGIFGIIGAILVDIYLTAYGMIFLSSMIYCIGFCFITVSHTRLMQNGDPFLAKMKGFPVKMIGFYFFFPLTLIGLCLTGVAKFSLKNSSIAMEKERIREYTNENNVNSILANMVKFAFGDDTEIFRYVQSRRYMIGLVILKYATKIVFIVASTIIDSIRVDSKTSIYYDTTVFFIPTVGLGLVTLMSLGYIKSFVKPVEYRGTPLKNVVRVCVAAIRKRHLPYPQSQSHINVRLYEEDTGNEMKRTNGLKFLEKAAVIESTLPEEERRKWKLCTITEVEETKCLLRMVFMCMTFLAYGMVTSMGNTFFLLQGNHMDTTLGNIDVPLQTLTLLGDVLGYGTKTLYMLLISVRLTGSAKRYSPPMKYAIGIVLATFCCTVASWIATDRNDEHDSVFWLTPQFILFGTMSGVTRDGIEGFFHDQLPPSMVRYDSVFTDAMIGAGSIFSTGLVYATSSSLDNILHLGKLYRLLTVLSFIILSIYPFVATMYRYQDIEEA